MSARMSRAELAVLLDELADRIDEWSVRKMEPEDAYNLGLVRQGITQLSIGVNG